MPPAAASSRWSGHRRRGAPTPLETFLSAQGQANLASPSGPAGTPGDVEQALTYVTGHPIG